MYSDGIMHELYNPKKVSARTRYTYSITGSSYRRRDKCLGVAPMCHLEVGKDVGMMGEMECDVDLRMTIVGEVKVVEGP